MTWVIKENESYAEMSRKTRIYRNYWHGMCDFQDRRPSTRNAPTIDYRSEGDRRLYEHDNLRGTDCSISPLFGEEEKLIG